MSCIPYSHRRIPLSPSPSSTSPTPCFLHVFFSFGIFFFVTHLVHLCVSLSLSLLKAFFPFFSRVIRVCGGSQGGFAITPTYSLDPICRKTKKPDWETLIPVDAATGGFVAPFLYPNLEWDFKLSLVKTINFSGHNYGLVYAAVGWVVWRSKDDLPDEIKSLMKKKRTNLAQFQSLITHCNTKKPSLRFIKSLQTWKDRCLANRNIELDDLESFRVEEKAIQLMDHVKTSSIEDCNPTTGNFILLVVM
ncbi:hypothetical protein L2E82_16957 [Cichorium intybus]|uniref:Uncharacterized protein n=1 Tax=Cichorium intybus TaxID=13427 RepID=A0ACB9F7M4_CICIN|nr:hypothetical protein L2E82_16957 [Cichorium intybus]